MAKNNYASLTINGNQIDIDPAGQVPLITYALESDGDFEQKKGSEVFNIKLPGTLNNQQKFNTPQNPSIIDTTPDQVFDKPQPATYEANGHELIVGKFFYESVKEQNDRIVEFTGKLYGLNGDWLIDLKEKSLYDFLNPTTHTFDIPTIVNSWNFDGRNEHLDYVYAPVRYRKPFGPIPEIDPNDPDAPLIPLDNNVLLNDLKPSLSIYWFLYRAFKSIGYRIVSIFFDTDYFRRAVMPWTFGGFDFIDDTRWEPLKFLAKEPEGPRLRISRSYSDTFLPITVVDNIEGAFDNSGTYQQLPANASLPHAMVWTYPNNSLALGKVRSSHSIMLNVEYEATKNSRVRLDIYWYHNNSAPVVHTVLAEAGKGFSLVEDFFEADIMPGDYIACRIYAYLFESALGSCVMYLKVEQFQLDHIRLTEGSTIDLRNYPKLKNLKILDLLKGCVDLADLSIQTDPIRKEVIIEPTHAYEIGGVKYPGYFNREQLDFSQKVDLSKESELQFFSDYGREFVLKFKDDPQDGGLKKIQDRNQSVIGMAKYLLPERFKADKKELENRFFSPTMHYEAEQWAHITGVAPQLIAIIPENIANTSSAASENTFQPKITWYKGLTSGVGGWKFNNTVYQTLPFMFSVNYKAGGENDPVFSYASQNIRGRIAKGLLEKFYMQRMAIFRHGRRYTSRYLRLNNYDVSNFLHRESLIINGMEYLLTHIRGYNPMGDESTDCTLWLFSPVSDADKKSIYPSLGSLKNGAINDAFDLKYWQHLLLSSDITKQ